MMGIFILQWIISRRTKKERVIETKMEGGKKRDVFEKYHVGCLVEDGVVEKEPGRRDKSYCH